MLEVLVLWMSDFGGLELKTNEGDNCQVPSSKTYSAVDSRNSSDKNLFTL